MNIREMIEKIISMENPAIEECAQMIENHCGLLTLHEPSTKKAWESFPLLRVAAEGLRRRSIYGQLKNLHPDSPWPFIINLCERGFSPFAMILLNNHCNSHEEGVMIEPLGVTFYECEDTQGGGEYTLPFREAVHFYPAPVNPVGILNVPILTGFSSPFGSVFRGYQMSPETARACVKDGHLSAIGHDATAKVATMVLGTQIAVNRIQYSQGVGDHALVLKLNGRLPEGQILSMEDLGKIGYSWQYLIRTA